uniref:BZIP domain-containing protein n=1 Tax=Acrobeloides nanus TaxID=290746 RepID=A0A914DV74_9BILA
MFWEKHEMFVDPKEEKKIRNRKAAEKYRRKKENIVKELEETIMRLEKEKLEMQNNFSRIQQQYNDLLNEKAQWLDLKFSNACCMMKCQNIENSCFQEKQEPNHGSNLPELSDFAKDEEFVEFTSPVIEKTSQVLSKEWGSESILLPIYGNISV